MIVPNNSLLPFCSQSNLNNKRELKIIIINTLFKVDITTKLVKNKIAHYKLLVRLIKVNYHILNILKMLKM